MLFKFPNMIMNFDPKPSNLDHWKYTVTVNVSSPFLCVKRMQLLIEYVKNSTVFVPVSSGVNTVHIWRPFLSTPVFRVLFAIE